MIEFFLASENLPFSCSLAVMLAIALLEGVATLVGAGFSQFLDSMIPDLDIDADVDVDMDMDMDADADFSPQNTMTRFLGWLRVGQVPVLILLVIFLTAFGLIGLGVQSIAAKAFGGLMPGLLASIPALLLAMPVVRGLGGILGRFMPKDETEAVTESSFIGRVAVITLGRAVKGKPAEAKLKDKFGQVHYVMVEPDVATEVLEQGAQVLLVNQAGPAFTAIKNPNPALVNE